KRVACDDQQIGIIANFYLPDLVAHLEQFGGVDCGGLYLLERGERSRPYAELFVLERHQLAAQIGSENDLYPIALGNIETLRTGFPDALNLGMCASVHPKLQTPFRHLLKHNQSGNEERLPLDHQLCSGIIEKIAMFNGPDAIAHRPR